jgi:hypothetical protein
MASSMGWWGTTSERLLHPLSRGGPTGDLFDNGSVMAAILVFSHLHPFDAISWTKVHKNNTRAADRLCATNWATAFPRRNRANFGRDEIVVK